MNSVYYGLKSCIFVEVGFCGLQEEVLAENTFLSTPLILPRGYSLFIASNYFGDYFFEHDK
jgi:hypothetical protein